jgi:glycosyltransferase involved in cell wall biosynthesis
MKVLMIAPRLFPWDRPSVGAYYLEHAIALKSQGVEVKIINIDLQPLSVTKNYVKKFMFRVEKYKLSEIDVLRINGVSPPKIGYLIWVSLAFLLVLNECIFNGRPNIVLAQRALLAGSAAKMVKRLLGIPYVLIEHSSAFISGTMSKRDTKRALKAFRGASSIAAVSRPLGDAISNQYPVGILGVIPNVVRTDVFFEIFNKSGFDFVTVSNLDDNKRTQDIIKSFHLVNKDIPYTKLHIVGDGPNRRSLEGLVQELDISSCVKFHGALQKEGVANVLARCHCFILASEIETFGVVVIEALAAGLPVICSDTPGVKSIITEGFLGEIIPTGDLIGFKESMLGIINNYECWSLCSEKRHQFVERAFSPEVVGRKIKNWIADSI